MIKPYGKKISKGNGVPHRYQQESDTKGDSLNISDILFNLKVKAKLFER